MICERTIEPVCPQARQGFRLEGLIACALQSHGQSARTLCMTQSAPVVPAERLLSLPAYADRILWSPTPEEEQAGVGAAVVLQATGEDRFVRIKDAAALVFQDLVAVALDGIAAPEPTFIGAFAFQAASAASAVWSGFGDARFVLPRIAYLRRADRAWLALSAGVAELSSAQGRARLAAEAAAARAALDLPVGAWSPQFEHSYLSDEADHWPSLVAGIRGEIAAGRLDKAVAARRVVLRGSRLPPAAVVLERLRTEAAGCTRFALTVGPLTFLGASPECLVQRSGLRVCSDALAGSVPGDDPACGAALLQSHKDRSEHAIVASGIRAVLAPRCASLSESGLALHRLRHVTHLRTRFEGILDRPRHVLDLAARLHPTAAVGGAPRRAALAWLAAHEQADRGLYAGPFGAFDRKGNGEFVVAIRAGLLAAGEAHLFAGAGIVAGSEIESELRETRCKLRGLLAALGVD
jgi:menaquinone-specific isochorismate synthase